MRNDLGVQLLALYSLFIVPIVIGALFFDRVAGDQLRQEIMAADLALSRAIAQETNTIIENALVAVTELSKYEAVINFDDEGMLTIFENFQTGRPDVNLIYRLDSKGIMISHYPTGPNVTVGMDFSFRDYFSRALETKSAFISLGRISPTTEQPVATAVMPIWQDGEFLGVVATNLKLQSLSTTLASIAMEYQENKNFEVVIIDAGGKIIASPQPENILVNYADIQGELSTAVLAGNSGNKIATDQTGVENLYSYVPVPDAGWGVVVSRPTLVAFATPNSFHRGVLLLIGIFSGIGIFFWAVLDSRVLTPLEKLAAYSQLIGTKPKKENPSNVQLSVYRDRQDQIGNLVRSFQRMEKAISARINELATLLETSQAVVSSLDSKIVLNRILEQVEKLMGFEKSAIVALDSQRGVFVAKASRGLTSRYAEGLIIYPDESASVTMRAIRTKNPILIQDTDSDPSFEAYRPRARAEGYRSFAAIPLEHVHSSPAALVLYSPKTNSFNENSLDLLVNFANQAAMAIENAELFSRSDTKLQEQTQRLDALIQSLEVGLVLEDLNGNVLFANRTVCDLASIPRELILGKPAVELYKKILVYSKQHDDDLAKITALLEKTGEREISLSLDMVPTQRYFRLKGFTVTDSSGLLIGRGQILQDITREYEVDRMKSSLISTVSHELRTPLAAIKGYATTLLADDVNWELKAQEEFIQIISSEADRLSELVNSLLDMSRIEAGNLQLSKGFCDLREIIQRGSSNIIPELGNRLVIKVNEDMPIIEADPQRLEVVVRNLVENAAKYADNDLPITVSAETEGNHVVVRVEDWGPGIPKGNQNQVFESFYRMENGLTRRTPGVGLGLAISRGLVAAHNGEIWFEPREKGTCIAFSIPLNSRNEQFDFDSSMESFI